MNAAPAPDDGPFIKTLLRGALSQNNKFFITLGLTILLFILGEVISPGFSSPGHILMILKVSAFLGVLSLAQAIVIIAGGEGLDLSVGASASMGAVIASAIINGRDQNLLLAVVVVLTIGMAIGLLNGIGVSFFKVPPLIMTLAIASVVNGMIIIYSHGLAIRGSASDLLKTISGMSSLGIPNIVIIWMLLTLIAWFILAKTKFGLILYGVGANELTAEFSGIRSRTVRMLAYVASAGISSLGGLLLLGYTGNAFMDLGSPYVLPSVAAVVIGGISLAGGSGSYVNVALGAIILNTISGILVNLQMGEAGKQVVFGLILLALLTVYGRQKSEK